MSHASEAIYALGDRLVTSISGQGQDGWNPLATALRDGLHEIAQATRDGLHEVAEATRENHDNPRSPGT